MEFFMPGAIIGIAICVGIVAVSAIATLLLCILTGKPWGKVVANDSLTILASSEEQTRTAFRDRLTLRGFKIQEDRSGLLTAIRKQDDGQSLSGSDARPMSARFEFRPSTQDTEVELCLKYEDFVICDTGEIDLLKRYASYLLRGDYSQESPPLMRGGKIGQWSYMVMAFTTFGAAMLCFLPAWTTMVRLCILYGVGWHLLTVAMLTRNVSDMFDDADERIPLRSTLGKMSVVVAMASYFIAVAGVYFTTEEFYWGVMLLQTALAMSIAVIAPIIAELNREAMLQAKKADRKSEPEFEDDAR